MSMWVGMMMSDSIPGAGAGHDALPGPGLDGMHTAHSGETGTLWSLSALPKPQTHPTATQQTQEPLKSILRISGLLETAQYKRFWREVEASRNVVEPVSGFDDGMRNGEGFVLFMRLWWCLIRFRSAIVSVVASTYKVVPLNNLTAFLHLVCALLRCCSCSLADVDTAV